MGKCYEIFNIVTEIRNNKNEIINTKVSLEILDDAYDALEKILEPYDIHPFIFSCRLNNCLKNFPRFPWALIAFEKEYRLAEHFIKIRSDSKQLLFTAYSIMDKEPTPNDELPPLSFIMVFDKQSLEKIAATKSPLLKSAWELLADKSEEQLWLCTPDPLPEDWVKENENR